MLRKSYIRFQKSVTVWSLMLIVLAGNISIEAAKSQRRGGYSKSKPNHDAIALSYGGHRGSSASQHHQGTQHVYTQHRASAPAPSAPQPMPQPNKPIGWNIPSHNAPVQQKTISNTNTGHQTAPHNPGYPTQNHNPPPYNTHAQYPQQPPSGFNGPPPAYNNHPVAGQPPAYNNHPVAGPPPYSAPNGVSNVGYPQHGSYPQQGTFHQQPGLNNPSQGSYPIQTPHNMPNGQQAPVINNFYGTPQQSGSSGGSLVKNALLLGGGALGGAALYGALTPNQDKTVHVIHETAPGQAPNIPPAAPPANVQQPDNGNYAASAIPNVPPVNVSPVPNVPIDSNVPMNPDVPNVPLAPMPDSVQTTIPNVSTPESATTPTGPTIPYAPFTESNIPSNAQQVNNAQQTSYTNAPNSGVPLAPFPADTKQSLQAPLKGAGSNFKASSFCIFATISIILMKYV